MAKGYPIDVVGGYGSLIERLAIEGDPLPSGAQITTISNPASASVTGGGYSLGSLTAPQPGRAFHVLNANVSASHLMAGQLFATFPGVSGIGTPPVTNPGWLSGGGSTASIRLDAWFRSADQYAGSAFSINVKQFIDTVGISVGGTPTVYASTGFTGYTLADDLNFNAAKTILVLGDSRNNGTGPTTVDLHPGKVITNFYRSKGIDARYVLKAYSGSTTGGHAIKIDRGSYDGIQKIDLIVYDLGTNDAAQARATATSVADMQTAITWKQRFWPNAKMLILGSPPLQNNTFETAMDALRTAQAAAITTLADPNVKFFSFKDAFNRAAGSNYVASDGADGTRIHPTDAGLTQMFDGGYSGFVGLRAWLDANMPSI